MNKVQKYAPEVRERAVRMVFEHQAEHESQWAAINSIASKIGCTAETLRKWVRQAERDQGKRAGLTSTERERLKQLERENLEFNCQRPPLQKSSESMTGRSTKGRVTARFWWTLSGAPRLISFRTGKRRRWRPGSGKIPEWNSLAAIAPAHMLTARGKARLRPFRLPIAGICLRI